MSIIDNNQAVIDCRVGSYVSFKIYRYGRVNASNIRDGLDSMLCSILNSVSIKFTKNINGMLYFPIYGKYFAVPYMSTLNCYNYYSVSSNMRKIVLPKILEDF